MEFRCRPSVSQCIFVRITLPNNDAPHAQRVSDEAIAVLLDNKLQIFHGKN